MHLLGQANGVLLTVRKNIPFPGKIWHNLLCLNLKTNMVRMPMLTDEGMESSLPGEIIDNIFHQLRLRTEQGKLTPIMFVAPGVDNFQHFRLLYNDDRPFSKNQLSPFCIRLPEGIQCNYNLDLPKENQGFPIWEVGGMTIFLCSK